MNTQKIKGTIKWYNSAKGYGFVQTDSMQGDIFFHYSVLAKDKVFANLEGVSVMFNLVTGPKGPQAFDIEVAS